MEDKKRIYVAYFLSEEARKFLLKVVPPRHPNVFGDHVTLAFGRHMEEQPYPIGEIEMLEVVGEHFDERGQCVAVKPSNIALWLANNQTPHITISCANGIRPIYSNELMKDVPQVPWKEPLKLLAAMDYHPRTPELWKMLKKETHHSYKTDVPCQQCQDTACHEIDHLALNSLILDPSDARKSVRQQVHQLLSLPEV